MPSAAAGEMPFASARQGAGMAIAIAKPAAASHPVLYFPRLIFPACVALRRSSASDNPARESSVSRVRYGFATTSCCTSRSSSISKSEYMS